jgi:hypothetical protein
LDVEKPVQETETMSQQVKLSEFDKRAEYFARVRALIMKIVTAQPGLTVEQISTEFLLQYGFLPRIENRLRDARTLGWVESRKEEDGLLHWYPKEAWNG